MLFCSQRNSLPVTMTLSRNTFFFSLLLICISPVVIWKIAWLSKTTATNGKVWFTGKTLELDGSISSHLVILFLAGKDSIHFNAPANLPYKQGEMVPVRYVNEKPSEARVNTFLRIWARCDSVWNLAGIGFACHLLHSRIPGSPGAEEKQNSA